MEVMRMLARTKTLFSHLRRQVDKLRFEGALSRDHRRRMRELEESLELEPWNPDLDNEWSPMTRRPSLIERFGRNAFPGNR